MREPRNPFRMLTSERITSDSTFLRLFGPGVLDLLSKDEVWDRIQIFRSAPGGGKTSLFRLFTPQSLLTLYDSRNSELFRDLYIRLKALDVISDDGPNMLGIYLSFARNYAVLEDLEFDRGYKDRLLYSLLNSRITLAALRNSIVLNRLTYPDDLSKLQIRRPEDFDIPTTIPIPCSGTELCEWASSLERNVCKAIDSFGPVSIDALAGHNTLHSLFLLLPECILYKNSKMANRTVIMLDDVHRLASIQRRNLLSVLFDLKLPIGVWIAERLEALSSEEILSPGARPGRDYVEVTSLEEFWRGGKQAFQFEKTVANIADRRVKLNPHVQIGSFDGCLRNSLDEPEWTKKYNDAFETVSRRVNDKTSLTKKFDNWKSRIDGLMGGARERALGIRELEIMIDREKMKAQRRLLDLPIPLEEFESQRNSSLMASAELFLMREFGIPYYYGFSRLARMSSSNIEQFLMMGGELFEEVISAALLKQSFVLSGTRQEEILRKVANRVWKEIPRTIPNGRDVMRLLESIRQLCTKETFRPNAPYAPGVTGIAISMNDRKRLVDPESQQNYPVYARLSRTLSACISNNLLEVSLDRKQGAKGKRTWMILYLNRLLCLHFGLPLQYGGWRPRRLHQVCLYLEKKT